MVRKIFFLFFSLLFQISIFGQTLQEVAMQVFPEDSYLKIDSQILVISEQPSPFFLNLKPGKYPIEIWASQFEIFRDTLVVNSSTRRYSKVLTKRSSSFEKYKKEIGYYNKSRLKRTSITAGLIAANLGALYYCIVNTRLKKIEKETEKFRALHLNLSTPASLQANRAAFNEANKKYNRNRTIVYLKRSVGIPLVLVSSYFSRKYLKKLWSKKLEAPQMQEDKNPFVFSGLELNTMDATCQLSLKFNF